VSGIIAEPAQTVRRTEIFPFTAMPDFPPEDDPPPVAPVRPEFDDCCGSGCNPCIFELYEQAVERFEAEYKAWEARRMKAGKDFSKTGL